MAARLQLQIQGSGSNFAFDVEGEWTPRLEPTYKAASEPPELEQILATWEFRGCRIVPSDGTTETLWTDIAAFFARFESRTSHPTYVRLVRDPAGDAAEVLKIGGDNYEGLRFSLIEGEQDPDLPDASWGATGTFGIEVSAVRKFADANGIVGFSQEVRVRYEAGFRILEWDTTIRTEEGTSAVTKAKTFAAIDISSLPTYSFQTNGPDGIEWEELDADEENSRVPTVVSAVSRVREWGVVIGATGGGVSPDDVFLEVSTRTNPEEVITTTRASAKGPNAQQWVLSHKPGGDLYTSETVDREATAEFSATWEKRSGRGEAATKASRTVEVTISGGGRPVRLRPIANGLPPIVQRGAFLPYTAEVSVTSRRQGGTGLASELTLPPLLGKPWILDRSASKEGDPYIAERAAEASQHVWERKASLVYQSATKPNQRPSVVLSGGADVTSYLLA